MFQEAALFPWLNVLGNVMFGLRRTPGISPQEQRNIADHYLRLVGLEKFKHAYVHELSGGMKQRVALARALAPDPRVLLMDEPLASLDAMTRQQLYPDIQEIWQSRKKTIVLVTHNVREAVCLADRVVMLSPRPGRLREEFQISLPRPRDINDPEVAKLAQQVTSALKGHLLSEVTA
jgi:NitT/TauT family transport system ATP-binding protein